MRRISARQTAAAPQYVKAYLVEILPTPITMAPHPKRKIALLLRKDFGYCRKLLSGILSYRPSKQIWIHRDCRININIMPSLRQWEPDGIIAQVFQPDIRKALEDFNCPIINTANVIEGYEAPLVDPADNEVGQMAAHYFMEKGFSHFAYFGSATAVFSQEREKGFKDTLALHGHEVASCYAAYTNVWDDRDQHVIQWLKALPKPCALFTSNDDPARYLSEICSEIGIHIPNEVAMLGADNDEAVCRMTTPSLSSIELPAKAIGYRAAEMLDLLLRNKQIPERHVRMSPLRVINRESTETENHPDPTIRKLITIISETAAENPSVDEIAHRCHISRRVIEKKAAAILNTTVLNLIQKQQLKIAQNLLLDSYLPIGTIAEMCGMESQRRFNDVFKKKTGVTPSKFRTQHLIEKP